MPVSTRSQTLINIFNESKLLILKELLRCSDPLCGCDLIDRLTIPKNLLSYHIRSLREAGFLEEVRCGQKKQYFIVGSQRKKVKQMLQLTELI